MIKAILCGDGEFVRGLSGVPRRLRAALLDLLERADPRSKARTFRSNRTVPADLARRKQAFRQSIFRKAGR